MADQGRGRISFDYVYGGLLCENVVSATARDIMVPAMWRLENAGFDVLGCIHDEIWGQAEPGRDAEFKKLMCVNPSWCDMLIDSDLKVGKRYLK
jgi:DNA polymerase